MSDSRKNKIGCLAYITFIVAIFLGIYINDKYKINEFYIAFVFIALIVLVYAAFPVVKDILAGDLKLAIGIEQIISNLKESIGELLGSLVVLILFGLFIFIIVSIIKAAFP